jgi:hypothetical protein
MGDKAILCIVLSLCFNVAAKQAHGVQYDKKITTTAAHAKPGKISSHHSHSHSADKDKEVAKMAISTLASMATNLINIGMDPHNPKAVGANVVNLISSFVNFVTEALRNPEFAELLNDELFQETLRNYIMRSLAESHPEMLDEITV